jgi:MFS family permease
MRIVAQFNDWPRVLFATLITFLTTLIIVGYQALLPIMKDAGVYEELCKADEATPCHAQQMRMDLMFTLATTVINLNSLFVGFFISRTSPRTSCVTGGLLICAGALVFAMSTESVPAWIAGYVLMAFGAPFVVFSMFTVPQRVQPSKRGLAFSLVIGAFDGSAAMTYFMLLLHRHAGFDLRELFLAYATLPAIGLVIGGFWLHAPPKDSEVGDRQSLNAVEETNSLTDQSWLRQAHLADKDVLKTPQFWIITAWIAVFMTSKYFYMQNVDKQLLWIANDDHELSKLGSEVFSILLPAAGALSPITGYIIDRGGAEISLLCLAIIQGLVGILGVIKIFNLQYITMFFLVFNRFLFWAVAPFLLSALYGPRGVSTIYGMALFFAALVNLSNYLWTYLGVIVLDGDWLALVLVLNLTASVYGIYFAWQVRQWHGRWKHAVNALATLAESLNSPLVRGKE